MYKKIIIPAVDISSMESALAVAIPIAEKFNAQIRLLFTSYIPNSFPTLMISEGNEFKKHFEKVDAAIEEASCNEVEAQKQFSEMINANQGSKHITENSITSITASWASARISETHDIGRQGSAYDLVIFGQPNKEKSHFMRGLISSFFSYAGRPIVITPPRPSSLLNLSAAIVWDTSPAASRGIQLSLPLLACASQVSLISIGASRLDKGANEHVLDFLQAHNLTVDATEIISYRGLSPFRSVVERNLLHADFYVGGGKAHYFNSFFGSEMMNCVGRGRASVFLSN